MKIKTKQLCSGQSQRMAVRTWKQAAPPWGWGWGGN